MILAKSPKFLLTFKGDKIQMIIGLRQSTFLFRRLFYFNHQMENTFIWCDNRDKLVRN